MASFQYIFYRNSPNVAAHFYLLIYLFQGPFQPNLILLSQEPDYFPRAYFRARQPKSAFIFSSSRPAIPGPPLFLFKIFLFKIFLFGSSATPPHALGLGPSLEFFSLNIFNVASGGPPGGPLRGAWPYGRGGGC